jgi:hypothetical protein
VLDGKAYRRRTKASSTAADVVGTQAAWRVCNDGRGWRADVEYVVEHEWGRARHVSTVPPERVRVIYCP